MISSTKDKNTHHEYPDIRIRKRGSYGEMAGEIVWISGPSGSGKSTIALRLQRLLAERGVFSLLLDADDLRKSLNLDLGYGTQDRVENIRRIAQVAKLLRANGLLTICASMCPTKECHDAIGECFADVGFVGVHLDCSIDVCEQRDVKGLYRKARNGEIKDFVGVHSKYEPPKSPDLGLRTSEFTVQECTDKLLSHLRSLGIICAYAEISNAVI